MYVSLKKFSLLILLNSLVFLMMMIGIQNSNNKTKINFVLFETINLPISFILGSSFIIGSLTGSIFLGKDLNAKKDLKGN